MRQEAMESSDGRGAGVTESARSWGGMGATAQAIGLLGCIGVTILSIVSWGSVNRSLDRAHTSDALHVAGEIHRDLLENPRDLWPEEADAWFVWVHENSMAKVGIDEGGRPVDAWGTPFRTTHDRSRPVRWVRCESAGPDREFGTADDLTFESSGGVGPARASDSSNADDGELRK